MFRSPEKRIILQGGDSKNYLKKILNIFVNLGLKILILLRLREVFETDIIQC